MKGDFTRFTHNPEKHFSSVLKQQGRVDLDADWNEYAQIQDYLKRTSNRDIIGRSGVPYANHNGFLVGRTDDGKYLELNAGKTLPGRIYVDGILCELEKDLSIFPNPGNDGPYMVYLDVWQRHISVIEDSEIVEIALGGPDTTTRVKTEWQVRFLASDKEGKEAVDYCKFRCSDGWTPDGNKTPGKLKARAEIAEVSEGLCEVEAKAGYRGLENRLYRVEIHNPGKEATFKWSRDNGSVAFSIQALSYSLTTGAATITLKQPAKDEYLTLKIGDWIEISDDQDELNLKKGLLAQVVEGSDLAKRIVVITASKYDIEPYLSKSATNLKLRRWDQKTTSEVDLENGVVKVAPGKWIPLEDGIEVNFSKGDYQIGDYWLIPARTRSRDIIWPLDGDKTAMALPRQGIEHHYCVLALATYQNGLWTEPVDCRRLFPSLNDLKPACCIPVHPGENIQEIINCVVASGGGCICLCDGVHNVSGPLKLVNAQNLTICGENTATVVNFQSVDENGSGGFILENCLNVTITGMLMNGEDLPSLISTGSPDNAEPNYNIVLSNLTLFNRGIHEEFTGRCAIRLGNTDTISIEGCRMLAENGIISRFGDNLPVVDRVKHVKMKARILNESTRRDEADTELNYGIGVLNLRMKDSVILYRRYGIWSLKSIDWNISGSRIVPVTETESAISAGDTISIDESQKNSYNPDLSERTRKGITRNMEKISKISINRVVAEYFVNALTGKPLTTFGTAIKALIWKACRINNCTLGGSVGINAIFWVGGGIYDSKLVNRTGILTLWLHEGAIANNTIESPLAGIVMSGCYSSNIQGNHISSAVAIQNAAVTKWLKGLQIYLSEISRAYSTDPEDKQPARVILWVLLEEACTELGLEDIRDTMQELLDTIPPIDHVAILLFLSSHLYSELKKNAKLIADVPMPLIALKITQNEISAGEAGIRLLNFIPLGGLNIANNRIRALTGQAIEVKANPYTVNPYIVIVGLRFIGQYLPEMLVALVMLKNKMKLDDPRIDNLKKVFEFLNAKMSKLVQLIEPVMEADFRIENNTIRSQYTAIEANIFELAVQNNHITMVESKYSNEEAADIIDILDQNETTHKLGTIMKKQSKAGMKASARTLNTDNAANKKPLIDVAGQIKEKTTNPALKAEADKLQEAAKSNDAAKTQESVDNITDILAQYINTCGIWVKGAGCRIVGNQVVVPLDIDSKTWAQGGIRFWDDEGSPIWVIAYAEQFLHILKPNMEIPSLLSSTETLIDNNEINRGIGNGVEIGGIANLPLMGLTDLKIRGNQIRDMAGAGIVFDDRSITSGVDIEDNRILDCGNYNGKGVIVNQKGGIIVRNTISCRIHNNRIKCQSNISLGNNLFAVDLLYVYGLSMTDNHIEHLDAGDQISSLGNYAKKEYLSQNTSYFGFVMENMCGAVKVIGALGEIGIQHNELIINRGMGIGLFVSGFFTQDKVPGMLKFMAAKSLNTPDEIGSTAGIQGNYFRTLTQSPYVAFLVDYIRELSFLGNNVRITGEGQAPGFIESVQRVLITGNMLDTLNLENVESGAISGNVCHQAFDIPAPFSGKVDGANYP